MSNLAGSLPPPTPLRQGLLIRYQWGQQRFECVAIACSIRTTLWEETGEQVTWLHCKAIQTLAIKPDGAGNLMNVLIPAHYVTHAEPGPTFRITRARTSNDLGVFPPNQPPPDNPFPLGELQQLVAGLVEPSLN